MALSDGAATSMRTWRATFVPSLRETLAVSTSTSTGSRRFPTSWRPLGARLAAKVAEIEPDAAAACGPGARCRGAGGGRLARRRGVPFLIVRGEAKAYGTAQRIEGAVLRGGAGRPHRGRRHLGRRGRSCRPSRYFSSWSWNAARPSVSSTGRRAVWTPSRASACACIPCFVRHRSSRGARGVPQSRMVERHGNRVSSPACARVP